MKWLAGALLLLSEITSAHNLTLDDVLNSVVEHYPMIKVAEKQINRAQAQYLSAQGQFDTQLESIFKSTPQGGYENNLTDTRIVQPFENSGAKLFASYRNGQGDWPIYYKFNETNRGGETAFGLSVPLWRDFAIDARRAKLISARIGTQLETAAADFERIRFLLEGGQAYWQWVFQVQRVFLNKRLLSLAKVRQVALERRAKLGDVSEIEQVENQRFILQRQASLLNARLQLQQAANVLSLFYRNAFGDPLVPKTPTRSIDLPPISTLDYNAELIKHERNHIISSYPAARVLAIKRQLLQVKQDLAENTLRPVLDAEIESKKELGSGGDPRLQNSAVHVGLRFAMPLQFREGRGRIQENRFAMQQLQQKSNLLAQKLNADLNNTLTELDTDRRQISIIDRELVLAQKIEAAEVKRFNQGDSFLFLVNQREQTTFSIQLKTLQARIAYYRTLIGLQALCGFDTGTKPCERL